MNWPQAIEQMAAGAHVRQRSLTRHTIDKHGVVDIGVAPIKLMHAWLPNGSAVQILVHDRGLEPVQPTLQMVSAEDWEVVT